MKDHSKTSRTITRKRDQQMRIWLSRLEYARLRSKADAGGETVSGFLRRIALWACDVDIDTRPRARRFTAVTRAQKMRGAHDFGYPPS